MARRVKEFVDIKDFESLDELIDSLKQIRDSLPDSSEAELKIRGDDVFGRKLCISYFRDQTAEEAELDARYSRRPDAEEMKEEREDGAAPVQQASRRKLRIVA